MLIFIQDPRQKLVHRVSLSHNIATQTFVENNRSYGGPRAALRHHLGEGDIFICFSGTKQIQRNTNLLTNLDISGRGNDTVGIPHRAQISQIELFELILLLKQNSSRPSNLRQQFPAEQFGQPDLATDIHAMCRPWDPLTSLFADTIISPTMVSTSKHWVSTHNIEFHPSGNDWFTQINVCFFWTYTWRTCSQIPICPVDGFVARPSRGIPECWVHGVFWCAHLSDLVQGPLDSLRGLSVKTYIYIYTYMYMYDCIYIYIYISWHDTEKICMAPAQGWRAQIEKCKHVVFV